VRIYVRTLLSYLYIDVNSILNANHY